MLIILTLKFIIRSKTGEWRKWSVYCLFAGLQEGAGWTAISGLHPKMTPSIAWKRIAWKQRQWTGRDEMDGLRSWGMASRGLEQNVWSYHDLLRAHNSNPHRAWSHLGAEAEDGYRPDETNALLRGGGWQGTAGRDVDEPGSAAYNTHWIPNLVGLAVSWK